MKIGGTACKWAGITETIDEASARLRGSTTNLVQIEKMDAFRLIERYDTPDALIYIDPPYVRSSRKSGALYVHEMTDQDQIRLLDLIISSRAKIIISGYDNPIYNEWLSSWNTDTTMCQTKSTVMACEKIWMNYIPPNKQVSFDDIMEGRQ